jgi:hypothetical protein
MISLGARYIDYGLTGGFFLFVALAVFGWHHPEAVSAILEKLPDLQKNLPVGETVLASFFVVCVFATGLLLDLVGSLALVWELSIFRLGSTSIGTESGLVSSLRSTKNFSARIST